jgi:hypothetical protein
MNSRICKLFALLASVVLASSSAMAGVVPGTAFASSDAPDTAPVTMLPGQTYTMTATITANGSVAGLTFNQIALSPNLGSQFQIVGGTCNTSAQYIAPTTCTVIVRFIGATPGNFTADLLMGCNAIVAQAGGYVISCNAGANGVASRMAVYAGNGIAAVVDALGREGLTLLAAALFALTAFVSLRRRT